jgi:hypothetical protein
MILKIFLIIEGKTIKLLVIDNVDLFIRRMAFWLKGLTAVVALCALGVFVGVPVALIMGKILNSYSGRIDM